MTSSAFLTRPGLGRIAFAATLIGVLALPAAPALAAIIAVGGACTLPNAITAANNNAATAGCTAGSGADTITLPAASTITLTTADPVESNNALPVITSVITLQGNGATITRDPAAPKFRLLAVNPGASLTLQNLTLSGGRALDGVASQSLTGNRGSDGGAVASGGSLAVTNCTFTNNQAGDGGGSLLDGGNGGNGGAIFLFGSGTLTLSNSTLFSNQAGAGRSSSLGDGGSGGSGGAIFIGGSSAAALGNNTLSSNQAGIGGDHGNIAPVGGAGGSGGAIFLADSASLTMSNNTLTSNRASSGGIDGNTGFGGGLAYNGNSASSATLRRNLIANNFEPFGRTEVIVLNGNITVGNYNLFGFNNGSGVGGFVPGPTDIVPSVGIAAILAPLAGNGGPTQTHALVAGSPAIDAVVGSCSSADQRGIARPQDGNNSGSAECDIGAFEFIFVPPPTPVLVTARFTSVLSGQSTNTTPVTGGPAGVFSFTSRFCSTSREVITNAFSRTRELSPGKSLLSRTRDAASAPLGGVGSEQTFPDTSLTWGECVDVPYRIGLDARTPFTFRVDLLGVVVAP